METKDKKMAEDIVKAKDFMTQIQANINNCRNTINSLKKQIENGEFKTEKGLNLLELKNQSFLSYLTNLSYVSVLKLAGKQLEGHSAVDRIVQLRVLLERLRPLERKHEYQIDKLMKIKTGSVSEDTNSTYKVRAEFSSDESDKEDDAEATADKTNGKDSSKSYKVPKIQSMKYSDDEEETAKEKEKKKRRFLHTERAQEILAEHNEDPESYEKADLYKKKAHEKLERIRNYEEDTFTRLTLSSKEQHSLKKITTAGTLADELLGLRDFVDADKKNKKRKQSGGKGGKKGSSKKRKKH